MLNRRQVVCSGLVAAMLPGIGRATARARRRRFRRKVVTRQFHNPAAILTNRGMKLKPTPYPSLLTVDGFNEGVIRNVQVILHGFTHEVPESVALLLVGPTGRRTLLFANAGVGGAVSDVTLVLSARATTPVPAIAAEWASGVYQPVNYDGPQSFNGPSVEQQPVSRADLTVFAGSDPEGVWRLYVADRNWFHGFGEITRGWSLRITGTTKVRIR